MSFFPITLNQNGARNYSINSTSNRYQGNAILQGNGAMPAKFYPSAGSNMFSLARTTWVRGYGQNEPVTLENPVIKSNLIKPSSDYIRTKHYGAIGRSSYTLGQLAFSSMDKNTVNHQRKMVRSGGSTAPAKKGMKK